MGHINTNFIVLRSVSWKDGVKYSQLTIWEVFTVEGEWSYFKHPFYAFLIKIYHRRWSEFCFLILLQCQGMAGWELI